MCIEKQEDKLNFGKKVVVLFSAIFVSICIFACKDTTVEQLPAPSTASYKVKHYKQTIPENGSSDYAYVAVEEDTETLSGVIGQKTAAKAKEYEGFTALAFEQKTIVAGGTTVIEIYYDRNLIIFTINLNGGQSTTALENGKLTGLYGAPVSIEAPAKTGFSFAGWNTAGGNLPEIFTEDGTYTAIWTNPGTAFYTVNHLQQTVDGSGYDVFESETLSGSVGAETSSVAKGYEGFTVQAVDQKIIKEDGSTVVEIKYKRNQVTLFIDLDGGETETSLSGGKLTGLYGQKIEIKEPAKQGYKFLGWNADGGVMPELFTANGAYKALWKELAVGSVEYKVKHFQQTVDGNDYNEITVDEQSGWGIAGEQTEAVAKEYTGFTVKTFSQETIKADDLTVVEIYYDRIKVTLTINLDGGQSATALDDGKLIGLYGADVSFENPVKSGFKFIGWNTEGGILPATFSVDGEYTALWSEVSAGNASYTVKHFQQKIDGSGYELSVTDTSSDGPVGSNTEAVAKEYTGFTVKSFSQETIKADGSTVVEIYYDRIKVTLTIDLDGGQSTTALVDGKLIGLYGAPVSFADPIKLDFTFDGWNSEGGKLPVTFLEDGAYKALWATGKATYTVRHFLQTVDGTAYEEDSDSTEIINGVIGAQTSAVAKDDYAGFTAQAFEQAVVAEGNSTVVEIKYNRISVALTVNLNGGTTTTSLQDGKLSCLYGGTVSAADPVKEDAAFEGWYKDAEFTVPFNFKVPLTKDSSIYARYKYMVSFVTNGGTEVAEVTVKDGETLPLPEVQKTGAAFAGWYTDSGFTAQFTASSVTKNTVLYARWSYSVTFNANTPADGTVTGTMSVQNIAAGSSERLTENAFSCEGYIFQKWNTKADGSGTDYSDKHDISVTESIVLYAQWVKEQAGSFPVTFDMNGGNSIDVQQVEEGTCAEQPVNPLKANAEFEGWYKDASFTTAFDFSKPITAATTVYARWKYTVSFNTNGGSEVASVTIKDGESLSRPSAPSKSNVSFDAWYLSFSAAEAVSFPMTVNADTTLYAKWKCTLSFNTKGGNYIEPLTVSEGGAVTLPAAEKTGVTFAGWYADSSFTTQFTSNSISVNTTVYARYISTITFDANGGSGTMQNMVPYSDASVALPANAFTRDGYLFLGWSTDADAETATYKDGESVFLSTDTKLYAVWLFRFSFVVVDNSDLTVEAVTGDNIILTAKSGYTNYKWTIGGLNAVSVIPGAVLSADGRQLSFSAANVKDTLWIQVSALNFNSKKYMTTVQVVKE